MSTNSFRDNLYAAPRNSLKTFVFDEQVAAVFDEMIDRSVPGYRDVVSMIGDLASRYVQPESHCYDLGCSLGAVTLAMRHMIQEEKCRIVAVDNSEPMIACCEDALTKQKSTIPVDCFCEDIREIPIQKASFVVLNLTLQFLPVSERTALLKKIYDGMLPGGVLVVTEKIIFKEASETKFQENLHHDFKKLHGYSDLEISQKRTALENVLIPETLEAHQRRLHDVGYQEIRVWFRCFNFMSLLALKS